MDIEQYGVVEEDQAWAVVVVVVVVGCYVHKLTTRDGTVMARLEAQ